MDPILLTSTATATTAASRDFLRAKVGIEKERKPETIAFQGDINTYSIRKGSSGEGQDSKASLTPHGQGIIHYYYYYYYYYY